MSDDERPSIEELIERSSLGTPEAKRMRARTDPEVARRIVERANALRAARDAAAAPVLSGQPEARPVSGADWKLDAAWRVGRSVGRTVYAVDPEAYDRKADHLIGVFDTVELAAAAVEAHNTARYR